MIDPVKDGLRLLGFFVVPVTKVGILIWGYHSSAESSATGVGAGFASARTNDLCTSADPYGTCIRFDPTYSLRVDDGFT
jgi:hypothetical protein